ncbi:hypothetical protein B0H17DRAFT_1158497 [Mycena rosella]|uniref:acetate--CoA ligase n=1 Tax=Mycena rosella TaxID=1033263 RepID=A0AAD7GP84_MYCRO|nr:hypothetical protein B0H17DRAFT_1158497 [Mycena rosella]
MLSPLSISWNSSTPHVGPDLAAYRGAHAETVGENSDEWWAEESRELLYWDRPFKTVRSVGFATGDIAWFPKGGLNVSYNCVDRWAFTHPDRVAIIYKADEPGTGCSITYAELLREVCSLANVLKSFGVRRGDTVSIYLPMTWHAAAAFLACARIGAIHSVVFAGFSAESLRNHVNDCASTVFITSDEGRRGGKVIATKAIVDKVLEECPAVKHCLVLKPTGGKVMWDEGRDQWWYEEVAKLLLMALEEPLFVLYTSGSTEKPKGVVHMMGGYLLCAALTVKYVFDVHKGNRFAYMADVGWITGHTCVHHVRPLLNGVSTVMFETTPPHWETVAVHGITHFYSAPTAVRLLRSPRPHLAPHTAHILIPTLIPAFPSAFPSPRFPSVAAVACADAPTPPQELEGHPVEGVLALKTPWPSIARMIHARYLETYMKLALIMHKGAAKTAVIGTADELTGGGVEFIVRPQRSSAPTAVYGLLRAPTRCYEHLRQLYELLRGR